MPPAWSAPGRNATPLNWRRAFGVSKWRATMAPPLSALSALRTKEALSPSRSPPPDARHACS
eukprot:366040-Chlamydomonas_euryale.AAC.10